jgi:DNA-binding transcriptional LysR family regulator
MTYVVLEGPTTSQTSRRTRLDARTPTIEQARAFCQVVASGSYSDAAEALGIPKDKRAPLARMVRRLAEVLGQEPLVAAAPDGKVSLTSSGGAVLPLAQALVSAADALSEAEPRIRLSAYPAIALRIAQAAPGMLERGGLEPSKISDRLRADGGLRLIQSVAAGRIDIAVAPEFLPIDDTVRSTFAYRWHLRVALPHGHELGSREQLTPAQIHAAGLRVVSSPAGHRSRAMIEEAFATDETPLAIAFDCSDPLFIEQVARNSFSLAGILPDDSFGATRGDIGPVLALETGRLLGGSYALYYRAPRATRTAGNEGAQRVEHMVTRLQLLLREAASTPKNDSASLSDSTP